MKVSLGRIVHYKIRTGEVRPAIVVNVLEFEKVNLQVFMDANEVLWCSSVPFAGNSFDFNDLNKLDPGIPLSREDEEQLQFPAGTWRWPPRES